jgi:hypothetical protein
MKVDYLPRAVSALEGAPAGVRKAFEKQIVFLRQNRRHPSLRAKCLEGSNKWQARINRDWRFYFVVERDTYVVLDIVPHPK